MARLKVYSYRRHRREAGARLQTREIVATTSWQQVCRLSRLTMSDVRWNGSETHDAEEVAQAMTSIGTIFWRPLDQLKVNGTYRWTADEQSSHDEEK